MQGQPFFSINACSTGSTRRYKRSVGVAVIHHIWDIAIAAGEDTDYADPSALHEIAMQCSPIKKGALPRPFLRVICWSTILPVHLCLAQAGAGVHGAGVGAGWGGWCKGRCDSLSVVPPELRTLTSFFNA